MSKTPRCKRRVIKSFVGTNWSSLFRAFLVQRHPFTYTNGLSLGIVGKVHNNYLNFYIIAGDSLQVDTL